MGSQCALLNPDQGPSDQPLQLTPKEEMETTLIQSLIASYFGITRQTIQDLVPKAIMHLLVSDKYSSIANNFRSIFLETRSSNAWSPPCTNPIYLATCSSRTKHWSRSEPGSRHYWMRTRRRLES